MTGFMLSEVKDLLASRWSAIRNGEVEIDYINNHFKSEEEKKIAREMLCKGITEAMVVIKQASEEGRL